MEAFWHVRKMTFSFSTRLINQSNSLYFRNGKKQIRNLKNVASVRFNLANDNATSLQNFHFVMLLESFIFVLICCYDYPKSPFLSFSFEKCEPACCVQIIMNKIGPVYLPQRSGDHLYQFKKSRRKRRGHEENLSDIFNKYYLLSGWK